MTYDQILIQKLRTLGYRVTPQREMIIEAISTADCHMSAEQVYRQVRERVRSVNIATVYRTLDLLVEAGLVSRADLGGGREVFATNEHGPHIHLVCRSCGQVIDADHQLIASLGEELRARHGFEADLQHVTIDGLCRECRSEKEH
jgi:Fur family ferric uptake transcriptional regulator